MTPSFEYHRPHTLEAALALLGRSAPATRPLAGGTRLLPGVDRPQAVVDLSALPLAGVERLETIWRIGAMTTLQTLATAAELPAGLKRAAERHAPRNIRQRATVGGVIASRSSGPLLAALLALDARVIAEPGRTTVSLQRYLEGHNQPGHLIVAVEAPVTRECALCEVSRSPADAPILVVAAGAERSPAGLRDVIVAAAGADQPAILLHTAAQLLEAAPGADLPAIAAVTPDLPWRSDTRGSKEYRSAMTPVVAQRAFVELLALEVNHAG